MLSSLSTNLQEDTLATACEQQRPQPWPQPNQHYKHYWSQMPFQKTSQTKKIEIEANYRVQYIMNAPPA